jgi:hypothetical protein
MVEATPARAFAARHRKKLAALALCLGAPALAHAGIVASTRIEPPAIAAPSGEPVEGPGGLRVLGPAYARRRGKILEVRLAGSPEAIGWQHARLLYRDMVADEAALYGQFERFVPVGAVRTLLMDVSRLEFRHVDRGMDEARRREVAAQALGFSPDPFASVLATYHRFVFLQALYDIALSFERSPLLGCTSFALGDGAFEGGHAVLARNFDFEAGPIFDEQKTVFLVREDGAIPYASVAWPGLVGAVTGMNAEGLALVVHGARARSSRPEGEPVVHTTRELLGHARSVDEAVAILEKKAAMVPHMILLADASGAVAIAERAPGEPLFVRRGRGKVPLTNHFEGPLASDPKNLAVEASTSTLPRRRRLDELLSNLAPGAPVERVVEILRDKKGPGGVERPLGDRRSIDALIATHAVVMDATTRTLWVSEGPHLVGRFVRFDLWRLLDPRYDPAGDLAVPTLPADPIGASGAYDAWLRAGSPHGGEPVRMEIAPAGARGGGEQR